MTVEKGASLEVDTNTLLDTTIAGNVTGDGCDFIQLNTFFSSGRIVVGGNLNIRNCTGIFFSGVLGNSESVFGMSTHTRVPAVLIGGNVKCENIANAACAFDFTVIGGRLECSGNLSCEMEGATVGKDVTLMGNGFSFIIDSAIGGDVKCVGNSGGVSGTGDTIAGTKSGQCSGL